MNESGVMIIIINFQLDFNFKIQDDKKSNSQIEKQNKPEEPKKEEKEEDISITNFIQKSSNPIVCLFTALFKILTISTFIILGLFTNNESFVIIITILLGSADFWYTKNVAGRLLVGLRYWNYINPSGEEVWAYQSTNEQERPKANSTTFWTSQYISTGLWVLLFFWELIRFKFIWCAVAAVCMTFSFTNLYYYLKCSKRQKENIVNFGKNLAKKITKKTIENA